MRVVNCHYLKIKETILLNACTDPEDSVVCVGGGGGGPANIF